jgi:hypothetical protein
LESAQLIVQTGAGAGVWPQSQHFGLLNELQDVECRNEEYPLSRAFLSLLHVLLSNKGASVPATVSVQPYVAFVRDQVSISQALFNWFSFNILDTTVVTAKQCAAVL